MNLNDYEGIVREHSPAIYRYCLFKLNNDTHSAEDVTSEVMLLLFQKWDSLDTDGNIRAWLYRAADNLIMRKRTEIRKHQSQAIPADALIGLENELSLVHTDEYFSDEAELIKKCTEFTEREFGEEGKELFTLRYIEKKTLTEISAESDIPLSTLHYRLFRIEKALKKMLSKNS